MLIIISGPMGAGKSYELIKYAHSYSAQGKTTICVKSNVDTRNKGIWSRAGLELEALSVNSLAEVGTYDVYLVDEGHFFAKDDIQYVEGWLKTSDVIVSGLDVGHRRELLPFFTGLYELKPDIIIQKVAECAVCGFYNAQYTQILESERIITEALDEIPVENGKYKYEARCRACFVTA